ncbi:hypothetical protein ACFFQF_32430 [Haladaptatus pallidirubidus]|nr:hypothetical protein [Haladaptatus pallidirubidus]
MAHQVTFTDITDQRTLAGDVATEHLRTAMTPSKPLTTHQSSKK